jgi:hypothetical protein
LSAAALSLQFNHAEAAREILGVWGFGRVRRICTNIGIEKEEEGRRGVGNRKD